jgi:glutaminase
VGDCKQLFTIQSISKPFVYGLALEDHGLEHVLKKVGVEPTGEAFNAIVLDEASNRPFNPMVNAGAIATADLIQGKDYPERVSRMLAMFGRYCGRDMCIDNTVFMSERVTGHRNRAIGHLMLNFGMVTDRIQDSLELYFQQCSVLVNSHDLAMIGATLANGGVNPVTGQRAIQQQYVKYLLSIMHSCGMYDYAGEWAYRVGIPAKSGVGGGIVAVVPGQFGIGIFSPPSGCQRQQCPRHQSLPGTFRTFRPPLLRNQIHRPSIQLSPLAHPRRLIAGNPSGRDSLFI